MGRHEKPKGTRELILDLYYRHRTGECWCYPDHKVEESHDAKFPYPSVYTTWPPEHEYFTKTFDPDSQRSREEARRRYSPNLEPEPRDTSHVDQLDFAPTLKKPRNND